MNCRHIILNWPYQFISFHLIVLFKFTSDESTSIGCIKYASILRIEPHSIESMWTKCLPFTKFCLMCSEISILAFSKWAVWIMANGVTTRNIINCKCKTMKIDFNLETYKIEAKKKMLYDYEVFALVMLMVVWMARKSGAGFEEVNGCEILRS